MAERTYEKELDALRADIAVLREELSSLVEGVKKYAGKAERSSGGEKNSNDEQENNGNQSHGKWTDYQETFEEAFAQFEKIIKNVAAEIERRPLPASIVAF